MEMVLGNRTINRRAFLTGAALLPFLGGAAGAATETLPLITVFKDASCGCCGGWIDHVKKAGFPVSVTDTEDMEAVKDRFKVPSQLYSCHTAEVSGFSIEGHVPVAAIQRLLAERPPIIGLSAPGMPVGSPGMETPGIAPEVYDIIAFDKNGMKPFARFIGDKAV